jgi:nitrogen fixation protein FixH
MAGRDPISLDRPGLRGDDSSEFRITGRMVFAGLVAFFAVVFGVNAIMIHAAISTFGGVETESSYRAGLAFANEMASAQAQDARHWNVTAQAALNGDTTRVEVTARDAAGRPLSDLAATAALVHPTDRRADHAVPLTSDGAGLFRGQTAAAAGQWDLVIELSRDGERLFRSKNRVWLR